MPIDPKEYKGMAHHKRFTIQDGHKWAKLQAEGVELEFIAERAGTMKGTVAHWIAKAKEGKNEL